MQCYLRHYFPQMDFSLWIIEQDNEEPFNRGWLANVGLQNIMTKHPDTECIIAHDVNMFPELSLGSSSRGSVVPYNQCDAPVQLALELELELENFDVSRVPYPQSAGGITSMNVTAWRNINGFSNDYIGWGGGEYDDLYERLRINNYLVPNTKGHAVFRAISPDEEHYYGTRQKDPVEDARTLKMHAEMRSNSTRWKVDGLADLHYKVTNYETTADSTMGGFSSVHHFKVTPGEETMVTNNKLEFVHVTKTGGSAIEAAAARAGIAWGACHYTNGFFEKLGCPKGGLWDRKAARSIPFRNPSPWHVPKRYFLSTHPFDTVSTFVVVRHPYTRAISEYYCPWTGYNVNNNSGVEDMGTPKTRMNKWLQFKMKYKFDPFPVSFLPQHLYVYEGEDKVVDHVLHFENLEEEFNALMQKFNLDDKVQLAKVKVNPGQSGAARLTVDDLDDATKRMIDEYAGKDFDLFGYERGPYESHE